MLYSGRLHLSFLSCERAGFYKFSSSALPWTNVNNLKTSLFLASLMCVVGGTSRGCWLDSCTLFNNDCLLELCLHRRVAYIPLHNFGPSVRIRNYFYSSLSSLFFNVLLMHQSQHEEFIASDQELVWNDKTIECCNLLASNYCTHHNNMRNWLCSF